MTTSLASASPSTTLPTVLFSKTPQVTLFGVQEADADRDMIVSHAISAISEYFKARESALNLCLHLYQCREAFRSSGETGWQAFCKRNFNSVGMGEVQIRSAVRTGRALSAYLLRIEDGKDRVASLETMSMSALTVVGDAPEEIRDRLIAAVSQTAAAQGKAPTAAAVRAEVDALRTELAEANGKLSARDEANARLVSRITTMDQQASIFRNQIEELTRQNDALKSAPKAEVTVLDADPKSKVVRDQLLSVEAELNNAKRALASVEASRAKAQEELDALNDQQSKVSVARDFFVELESAIAALKAKFTDAMIERMRTADPKSAKRLAQIGDDLRVLSEQIAPRLV